MYETKPYLRSGHEGVHKSWIGGGHVLIQLVGIEDVRATNAVY